MEHAIRPSATEFTAAPQSSRELFVYLALQRIMSKCVHGECRWRVTTVSVNGECPWRVAIVSGNGERMYHDRANVCRLHKRLQGRRAPGNAQVLFCMRHQLRALLQSCLCDIIAFRMICQNNYVLRLHRIMAVLFCTPSPMHSSSRSLRMER